MSNNKKPKTVVKANCKTSKKPASCPPDTKLNYISTKPKTFNFSLSTFVLNLYLYNGKELQKDFGLDWYCLSRIYFGNYGARFYDAELGRWHVADPMSEEHYNFTSYAYVYCNPVNLIDPLGLDTVWVFDQAERPEDDAEYTADIYVEQNGEINGPYTGSSYPDNDDASTLNEGEYDYNNEYGHAGGSRKGLNIVDENGNRNAPGTDPDGEDVTMQYVNVHDSFNDNSRNSRGCLTVPHNDPEGFFDNFDWSGTYNGHTGTTGNSTGTIIVQRGDNANAGRTRIENRNRVQIPTIRPVILTPTIH